MCEDYLSGSWYRCINHGFTFFVSHFTFSSYFFVFFYLLCKVLLWSAIYFKFRLLNRMRYYSAYTSRFLSTSTSRILFLPLILNIYIVLSSTYLFLFSVRSVTYYLQLTNSSTTHYSFHLLPSSSSSSTPRSSIQFAPLPYSIFFPLFFTPFNCCLSYSFSCSFFPAPSPSTIHIILLCLLPLLDFSSSHLPPPFITSFPCTLKSFISYFLIGLIVTFAFPSVMHAPFHWFVSWLTSTVLSLLLSSYLIFSRSIFFPPLYKNYRKTFIIQISFRYSLSALFHFKWKLSRRWLNG